MTRVRPAEAGLTLLEVVVVLWILAVLTAIAVPEVLAGIDELRTRAAARYVSGQCYHARFQAVKRAARVALRFEWDGAEYTFATFVDGNGNGVRTTDINRGVDARLTEDTRLSAFVGSVNFGIGDGVPLVDGGYASDPIRLGSGNLLTFGPDGTASTGSIYLRGARSAQYAVRVFGATGRTRVFRFLAASRVWQAQ